MEIAYENFAWMQTLFHYQEFIQPRFQLALSFT